MKRKKVKCFSCITSVDAYMLSFCNSFYQHLESITKTFAHMEANENLTSSESTPHKHAMRTSAQDMEVVFDPDLNGQVTASHKPTNSLHHPVPSGRKFKRQKQWDKKKVLKCWLHSILHVYSSLSSKHTRLFLPVVGHFLMSKLWCMRAGWSWQTGQTEENTLFFQLQHIPALCFSDDIISETELILVLILSYIIIIHHLYNT